jgi:hypothetical protein
MQIVGQGSSKTNLAQEKTYSTTRDHISICRFSKGGGGDGDWHVLVKHLKDMATAVLKDSSREGEHSELAQS